MVKMIKLPKLPGDDFVASDPVALNNALLQQREQVREWQGIARRHLDELHTKVIHVQALFLSICSPLRVSLDIRPFPRAWLSAAIACSALALVLECGRLCAGALAAKELVAALQHLARQNRLNDCELYSTREKWQTWLARMALAAAGLSILSLLVAVLS